jgi:hypothetical protein
MKKPTDVGTNRTGAGMSPFDSKEAARGAKQAPPSSSGGERPMAKVRLEAAEESEPIGSMPPPTSIKGAIKTAGQAIRGKSPTVLLDKLGERLAFERTGVRLYQAVIDRMPAFAGDGSAGPSMADLRELQQQELRHLDLVRRALETAGGDPTAMTPSADVTALAGSGVLKVATDPRMQLAESLQALLAAELLDNAGWELLIELTRGLGQDDMVASFTIALAEEQTHLERVRGWLQTLVMEEAGISVAAPPPAQPRA